MTTGRNESRGKSSALAIIAAGGAGAIVASLLNRQPASAATTMEIPQEVLTALAALVADAELTTQQLNDILMALGATGGLVEPTNPDEVIIFTMVPPIINTGVQFPEFMVAYDKTLIIRANPGNAGNMLIGNTKAESENVNSSWLLQANDVVGWKISNTKQLWVSCTVAGDSIMCTAEKRRP
jgi:hypothetical protein